MSDDVKRYSKYYDEMELEPDGDFVLFEDYERLRTELNEAADATGIAGVDEPMSLLQCIQSLRAELEGYKSALIGHGWIITSVDVDKYGQIGTGGGASK